MLKTIKTNIANCKEGYEPLRVTSNQLTDDTNGIITINTDTYHNLMSNDEVLLRRIDGQRIKFDERVKVTKITDDTEFTISSLGLLSVCPSSYELVDEHLLPVENSEDVVYAKFTFTEENKHIFCINRDEVEAKGIKGYYYWDKETERYTNNGRVRNISTNAVVIDKTEDSITCTETSVINNGDTLVIENINGELRTYTVSSVSNVTQQGVTNTVIYINETVDETIPAGKTIYERIVGFDDGYFCEGDYVLYDGCFLKQIQSDGGETVILNISSITLYTSLNIYGQQFTLTKCIVPVNTNGYDNRYVLLVPYENNEEYLNDIETYFRTVSLYCDDTRFWCDDDNLFLSGTTFKNGTTVNKITGNLELDFGIGENFSNDLLQRENFLDYAERVAGGSVNKIINYERYPYTPMYYNGTMRHGKDNIDAYFFRNAYKLDENLKAVRKLNFKLNFRVKKYTTDGSKKYRDYGSWNTDDTAYWNNYTIRNDGKCLIPTHLASDGVSPLITADLLGDLGFTDDDVFYQSDALKKSFLRLSFYDTPYRETQKLLFYSTVYFDTNELYKKYCNILGYNIGKSKEKKEMYVYNTDENVVKTGNVLDATLTCSDKFNDSASSDGFYLHLFDKMVSGNTCSMIYMKAEFNNAKYGKTVPLTMPTFDNDNAAIYPTNTNGVFPKDYFYADSQTVDMKQLLHDMYIKVMLKFDYKTNNFVWFFPTKNDIEEITLQLFEPRVTGYDAYSYSDEIGSGYGTEDGLPNWIDDESFDVSETNPDYVSNYALYTTAVTLSTDSLLIGTRLFNNTACKYIKSIWIDGLKVASRLVDPISGAKTTWFQLPDEPFTATTSNNDSYVHIPKTVQERWETVFSTNTYIDQFVEDTGVTEQKIHSVHYYFKESIKKDNTELYEELYKGSLKGTKVVNGERIEVRDKKTIECEEALVEGHLKTPYPVDQQATLPNGMFANINSLRNVYIKAGFDMIGNGAFSNCQGLLTVEKDLDMGALCIGKNAFSGCRNLKEAYLYQVCVILKQAFQGCYHLTNVYFDYRTRSTVGSSGDPAIKYIGCGAFGYTNIRKIDIPAIQRIGNSAFRRCYHLTNVTFSGTNNGFEIGKQAFTCNAILKYKLKRLNATNKKVRYKYEGIAPSIVGELQNHGVRMMHYYNSKTGTFVDINIPERGGKLMYQYRGYSYENYLDNNRNGAKCFEEWNK